MADKTIGEDIDHLLTKFTVKEVEDYYRDEYGVDVLDIPPNTPLKTVTESRGWYSAQADRATAPKAPKIEPLYGVSTEKNGAPLVAQQYREKQAAAAKRDAQDMSMREIHRQRMMEAAKRMVPVDLPSEGTATDDSEERSLFGGDKNLVVSPLKRVKGAVRGAVQGVLTPLDTLQKGYRDMEQDVEMVQATKSVPSRTLNDMSETAMAIPKIVAGLFEPLPKSTDEVKHGEEMGKGFVEGAIGGTAETYRHPWETFKAYPISTAAQLSPVGNLIKSVGSASKLALMRAARSRLPQVPLISAERAYVPGASPLQDAARAYGHAVEKAASDARAQRNPLGTGIIEEATAGATSEAALRSLAEGTDAVPVDTTLVSKPGSDAWLNSVKAMQGVSPANTPHKVTPKPPSAYEVRDMGGEKVLIPARTAKYDPIGKYNKIQELNDRLRLQMETVPPVLLSEKLAQVGVAELDAQRAMAKAEGDLSLNEHAERTATTVAELTKQMADADRKVKELVSQITAEQRELTKVTPKADKANVLPLQEKLRADTAALLERHAKTQAETKKRIATEQEGLRAAMAAEKAQKAAEAKELRDVFAAEQQEKVRREKEAAALEEQALKEEYAAEAARAASKQEVLPSNTLEAPQGAAVVEPSAQLPAVSEPLPSLSSLRKAINEKKAAKLATLDTETRTLLQETAALADEDMRKLEEDFSKRKQALADKHAKEMQTVSPAAKKAEVDKLRSEYEKQKQGLLADAEEYGLLEAIEKQEKIEKSVAAKQQELAALQAERNQLAASKEAAGTAAAAEKQEILSRNTRRTQELNKRIEEEKAALPKLTALLAAAKERARKSVAEAGISRDVPDEGLAAAVAEAKTATEGKAALVKEELPGGPRSVYRLAQAATTARAKDIAEAMVRKVKEVHGDDVLVNDVELRNRILDEFKNDATASLPVLLDAQGKLLAQVETDFEKANAGKTPAANEAAKAAMHAVVVQQLRDANLAAIAARILDLDTAGAVEAKGLAAAKHIRDFLQETGIGNKNLPELPTLKSELESRGVYREMADKALEYTRKSGLPEILSATPERLEGVIDALLPMKAPEAAKLAAHLRSMQKRSGHTATRADTAFYVTPDMNDALSNTPLESGWTASVSRWMKESLTTQNPAVATGNVASNIGLSFARNGPAATIIGVTKALDRLADKNDRAVAYWRKTGLLDTAVEDAGRSFTYKKPEGTSTAAHVARHAARSGVGPFLEGAYKKGDILLKAAEAITALDRYEGYSKSLGKGEFFDVELSNNVQARITSKDTVEVFSGNKVLREIPKEEALYRAAAKRANDLYVDFGVTPGISKALRKLEGVPVAGLLSAGSPFTTWGLATLDLPGKKGLFYRAKLEDTTGVLRTNSPTIEMKRAGSNALTSLQRATYINGMRSVLKDESAQELREALSREPEDTRLALIRGLGDPNYISTTGVGNWNAGAATDLGIRLLLQGYGKLTGAADKLFGDSEEAEKLREQVDYLADEVLSDRITSRMRTRAEGNANEALLTEVKRREELAKAIKGMSKEDRTALNHTVEFARKMKEPGYASVNDLLKFVYLSGAPLSQLVDGAEKNSTGSTVSSLLSLGLGGFGQKVISTAADAAIMGGTDVPVTRTLANRRMVSDQELNKESLVQQITRKVFSVAWRKYPLSAKSLDATSFVDKIGASWLDGTGTSDKHLKELESRIAFQQRRKGSFEAVDALEAELEKKRATQTIIKNEISRWKDQVAESFGAVSATKLPTSSK